MKILHTADWHIGKKLYNNNLEAEHEHFFNWLINTINEENIELLLVSGDIFDVGYPSTQAQKQYYNFLVALKNTTCREVIITGGNHDSVSTLEAPRELLKALNINVIGGLRNNPDDMLLPVYNQTGDMETVVAAVPFIRDRDLLKGNNIDSLEGRAEQIKSEIVSFYQKMSGRLKECYPNNVPSIAMGHFFMQNALKSDSERDIQVGNLGGVDASQLYNLFDYWALGHIHRSQKAGNNNLMRYSGSPLPLSFSEKDHEKEVLIIDTDKKDIQITNKKVPKFRSLYYLEGNYQQISQSLNSIDTTKEPKKPWVDIKVLQDKPDPSIITDLQNKHEAFREKLDIINFRIELRQDGLYKPNQFYQQNISELTPEQVFSTYLKRTNHTKEEQQELTTLFHEIIEEIYHEDQQG